MLNSESSSRLYLSTELNLLFKILRVFWTAVIHDEIKHGRHVVWPTCHAGHVDDASSGPPQQREEHLTHLHGSQEVHVHAESVRCDWLDLCVHGALKDSCVIHQTPQTCGDTTHETTVKSWLVQNRRDESFHTFYCGHPHPHNTHTMMRRRTQTVNTLPFV